MKEEFPTQLPPIESGKDPVQNSEPDDNYPSDQGYFESNLKGNLPELLKNYRDKQENNPSEDTKEDIKRINELLDDMLNSK